MIIYALTSLLCLWYSQFQNGRGLKKKEKWWNIETWVPSFSPWLSFIFLSLNSSYQKISTPNYGSVSRKAVHRWLIVPYTPYEVLHLKCRVLHAFASPPDTNQPCLLLPHAHIFGCSGKKATWTKLWNQTALIRIPALLPTTMWPR